MIMNSIWVNDLTYFQYRAAIDTINKCPESNDFQSFKVAGPSV